MREGWLRRQIEAAQKEVESWPKWMQDPKVRMRFELKAGSEGKP